MRLPNYSFEIVFQVTPLAQFPCCFNSESIKMLNPMRPREKECTMYGIVDCGFLCTSCLVAHQHA